MFYSKSGPEPITLWFISKDAIHTIRIFELNCMHWGLMQESNDIPELEDRKKTEGHSFPLCNKIIECLWTRPETFHLQTLCVLHHNTWRDSEGNAYPIFSGFSVSLWFIQFRSVYFLSSFRVELWFSSQFTSWFTSYKMISIVWVHSVKQIKPLERKFNLNVLLFLLVIQVKTSDGSVFPASFDSTSRCPDEVIRRIRLSSSYEDPSLKGRLLETYETHTDQFKIEPCCW